MVMKALKRLFLWVLVPAGDRRAAGEAASVRAEVRGVRGPSEGAGRAGPEGADGVPGPAGGVGRAPAQAAGRQRPPDEEHHQQVRRRGRSLSGSYIKAIRKLYLEMFKYENQKEKNKSKKVNVFTHLFFRKKFRVTEFIYKYKNRTQH